MMAQHPRSAARFLKSCADSAAQQTRAIRRGNVSGTHTDGRPIVLLPNGAKIVVRPTLLFEASDKQSVIMTKTGSCYEMLSPSAYGGGNGAPFVTPP